MSFIAPAVAAAGPVLSLAGGLTQVFGQHQQYKAVQDSANYNKEVMDQNAKLIETGAAMKKDLNERKKRSFLSTMRSQYAFRGVELSGSPLLAMAESASALETDIQTEEFNSLVDASRARSQASQYGIEASAYKKADLIGSSAGILTSVGKFAQEY